MTILSVALLFSEFIILLSRSGPGNKKDLEIVANGRPLKKITMHLMSVSSSTTTSHWVFGAELLRNLWRIANVLPQCPANRDKPVGCNLLMDE